MDTRQAYDRWSEQYDTNSNATRDLEARALTMTLKDFQFDSCLEIGCGTGKNTGWLLTKARNVTAVDLSDKMLALAKEKIASPCVHFLQADITQNWLFAGKSYDLVSFSLVLEHIEQLGPIFREAANVMVPGGMVYIGELHPFKQYTGSKARFDIGEAKHILTCFNHQVSDFTQAARQNGFELMHLDEFFDNDDHTMIPRILTLLFRKK
jgi:ubiquinone/menaquinone biosynthesis C-methylase UbiE